MEARGGLPVALRASPSSRTPVPRSKMSSSSPQRISRQGVLPPYRWVVGPGVGTEPRTPQKRTWKGTRDSAWTWLWVSSACLGFGVVVLGEELNQMSRPLALRPQVVDVMRIVLRTRGNASTHRNSLVHQSCNFQGVVGDEIHRAHSEESQHLRRDVVAAQVVREAQLAVGLVRVQPLGLERVGLDLVAQADAPALLAQVEPHAQA